ncbi:hypothetical protein [Lysobacter arvi]|uniref:Uncharacterized protein n=1 Tax=Lysobacter arvi TaxID=3038776 RepID=A0ABU1CAE3_9GAMM|nr:hypothetical protein [Lysobacter arvi]MDR0182173.1 hypothetical protein [Lysobacter arvi]
MTRTTPARRTATPLRRYRANHHRSASRLARSGAARLIGAHRRCGDGDALAIVCSPAAVHRGYRVTVVLDRLDAHERWSGKALIASATSPGRWLAILESADLSRRRCGSRARAAMLRMAVARIDEVESASHGVWPGIAEAY